MLLTRFLVARVLCVFVSDKNLKLYMYLVMFCVCGIQENSLKAGINMTYQVNNNKKAIMSITLFDNVKESITYSNKSYSEIRNLV